MSYFDLGAYSRPVTTSSAEAQTWFDRGLVWTYAYHHEEAIRCFQKALEHSHELASLGLQHASHCAVDLRLALLPQALCFRGGTVGLWADCTK